MTIPDCIGRLSGLSKLDITECGNLRALPPLPASLISINAHGCESLRRINSSFQNPNICLHFANCFSLNQEARNLIETSACKYAVLPGRRVPAHFTHRATSDSLMINLTPTPLPSSIRFRACILLSRHSRLAGVEVPADFTHQATSGSLTINITPRSLPASLRFKTCILLSRDYDSREDDEEDENLVMRVSCNFMGEQNGLTVSYGSNKHDMPYLYGFEDYLYTFEDSFCLDQDFPEATFSSLMFQFEVCYENWEIKACGVQLLRDGENTDNDDGRGDEDESFDEGEGTEDEDDEVGDGDDNDDVEDDVDTIQDGEEPGRNEDAETRSRKRKRL
ncbi:unnamed protein product, partial [Brassica oleracea var. botrytis]